MQLLVNGEAVEIEADPDTPLLYILRNDVGLKGVRFGCGLNQCGACFVLIDGQVTASCDTPLWFCENKSVTTVAGLDPEGPLVRAFVDEQAGQCAYCIPGIVMSAQALLDRNPHPTEPEVRAALDANLCRCGTHTRIIRAVLRAAAVTS